MSTYYETSFPKSDKQLEQLFNELVENISKNTPVDLDETHTEKTDRIARLEADGNEEEWFKYYFPDYCFCLSAFFQKASTKRILAAKHMMYQSRAWARGLSKSTRRMMEVMYLTYVRNHQTNCLLCSKSEDNAVRLLAPYKATFEGNQRLINDYGKQKNLGSWESNEFITMEGYGFRAVGAAQNPRGSKIGPRRINTILADDLDDDEVCRNVDRLDHVWEWWEQAVIPTIEIANPYYIFVDNNIIAEDSIQVRAMEYATDKEIINIRDEHGASTWPEKNTEEVIKRLLEGDNGKGLTSYASQQKEYFNNPMATGKTFKEITWGVCPPLKELTFVVVYADPATSNKDKPSQSSNLTNSRKSIVIIGRKGSKFYLYKCWLDVMGQHTFMSYLYKARDYINNQCIAFYYIECNSLQEPFHDQVISPLNYKYAEDNHLVMLGLTKDKRDKGEKWFRIEAVLEPLNSSGDLIFNIEEKENQHMDRMETQFKAAKPTSKQLDGPDSVEGAIFKINERAVTNNNDNYGFRKRERSSSKHY